MRLQYSLGFLLAFFAYVAVALAGFTQPKSAWNHLNFWLWLAALCWCALQSFRAVAGRGAPFYRGLLSWTLIYVCASIVEMNSSFGGRTSYLPHNLLVELIPKPPGVWISNHVYENDYDAEVGIERSSLVNISLAFGVVGGCSLQLISTRDERHN
jgi:hypothetical protein